jgi:endonuclease YncB( thermonuclease family)
MTERQYVYKITDVVKVTDGDTYWLRVDVGFRQENLIHVRLHGFDCPEAHRGSEYEKAQAVQARQAALDFFANPKHIRWIQTEQDPDNFGRWLGRIWDDATGELLGQYLRFLGLASVWPTRWRDEFEHLDAIPVGES